MTKKKLNIAIIGLGNIGSFLFKYLKENKNELTKKTNVIPNVIYVSAKSRFKKRLVKIPQRNWISNYMHAVNDKKTDIIIELIGGSGGHAKKLVFAALKNKKHVITANKALIAKHGDQLSKIAEKNKVNLEYEASVCGGLPIIRSIKEGLVANSITKIYGVFNGTSNYILSSMDKNNISFNNALIKAKKLGYAESNPLSDLNGEDVASKLKILTALSFNSFINKTISVEGIKNIDQIDITNANKLGYKIKLLGISEINNNKVIQRVHSCFVKKDSYIAKIDGVLNAVIIDGSPVGETIIQGEGAGPEATTSALISDLCSILRGNIKFPFMLSTNQRKNIKFDLIKNKDFSSYIRLDVLDKHGVLSDITKIMAYNKISIKRLIQNPFKSKKHSSIVIIAHKVKDVQLMKCLKTLSKKNYIVEKPKLIRIEDV